MELLLIFITEKLKTMACNQAFDPTIVVHCFNISAVCTSVSNRRDLMTQELEQLVTVFAGHLYSTFRQLAVTDPTSSILKDMCQNYHMVFPGRINFQSLPFYRTITRVDALITRDWKPPILGGSGRPSDHHILSAQDIAEIVQAKYLQGQGVPGWAMDFTFDYLSLDPLPSAPIIVDCLKAIAIYLGCDISVVVTPNRRYVSLSLVTTRLLTGFSMQAEDVSNLINEKLKTMVDQKLVISKRQAICTLLPYTVFLEQRGQQEMADAIMGAIRSSRSYYFMPSTPRYINMLFGKPSSSFQNWLIALVAPCMVWEDEAHGEDLVAAWGKAVSNVSDTEEVIRSVIDTLMQVTNVSSLRSSISPKIWAWMKKWQSLPVADWGRFSSATPDAVSHVRRLGDLEITKSCSLALLMSHHPGAGVLDEVERLIREDFGGIRMQSHREDLLNQLDYILEKVIAEMRRSGCHELAFFTFFSLLFYCIDTCCYSPSLISNTSLHSLSSISPSNFASDHQENQKARVFKPMM